MDNKKRFIDDSKLKEEIKKLMDEAEKINKEKDEQRVQSKPTKSA